MLVELRLVEQRYRAVCEVLDGAVIDVARRNGVARQTVHDWLRAQWRLRARHRRHEPDGTVERASDTDIVALLYAGRSARDRLVVLLMARAGLRRGELCGLRRSDLWSATPGAGL